MKKIGIGISIVLAVLLIGFLYRNSTERVPMDLIASTTPSNQACTADAKICPDVSASSTLGFVLPSGYAQLENGSQSQTTLRVYQKATATNGMNHTLTVSQYPIEGDTTAILLMLQNTVFDPSGMQATSTNAFKQVTYGKNTFYVVTVGRFEGQVETEYYLPVAGDTSRTLYRFDLIERNVTNWTDPNLNISTLPEHQAIAKMLSTVQVSSK